MNVERGIEEGSAGTPERSNSKLDRSRVEADKLEHCWFPVFLGLGICPSILLWIA